MARRTSVAIATIPDLLSTGVPALPDISVDLAPVVAGLSHETFGFAGAASFGLIAFAGIAADCSRTLNWDDCHGMFHQAGSPRISLRTFPVEDIGLNGFAHGQENVPFPEAHLFPKHGSLTRARTERNEHEEKYPMPKLLIGTK
ncbi:hypothetical protein AB0I52_07005 [Streptomyces sp. NPDC050423]|uniref:hypothetical protein n=1 Tax=Streptomyces sp. NPDC050423 TaxID=3155402 RepID=UPI00342501FE